MDPSPSPTPVFTDPLWDLMLSTNDCYPGCSCEDDFFDQTAERVAAWVTRVGPATAMQAIRQLNSLLAKDALDLEKVTWESNRVYDNQADLRDWLATWKHLLESAGASPPSPP
jgi:hypothetical protein